MNHQYSSGPNKYVSNQELPKFHKVDILEKLPEDAYLRSYNEEFYSTLTKSTSASIPLTDKNKLFYHFEQNINASVSSTTGQLEVNNYII